MWPRETTPILRDRKKERQRALLISTAVELFGRDGYGHTRMEDIARAAGVSTKTVYNYFGTKRDILIEFLVRSRVTNTAAQCEAVLETPSGDLLNDLVRLMRADIGDLDAEGGKALWLEIMAVAVRERADERFRRYRWMFTSQIERLLAFYKAQGKLTATLDTALAANMVHVMFAEGFMEFCASEHLAVEDATGYAARCLREMLPNWQ